MSSTFLLWQRGIQRGFLTAKRESQWATAFGALFGILLLLQLLLLGLFGLQGFESLLRERTDLRLEIQGIATDEEIREFIIALKEQSFVANAEFVTREQAFEKTKTMDPELVNFINQFGMENPFPDSVTVNLRSLNDYATFEKFVKQEKWGDTIDPTFLSKVTTQEEQVEALLDFTHAGRSLAIVTLVLVGGILVFIITELVRRRLLNRADEVLIERLVGAHPITILLPFATETTLLLWIAIVGSSIAAVGFLFLMPMIIPAFEAAGIFGHIGESIVMISKIALPIAFAVQLLLAPILAGLGASLGLWKHMRAHTLSLT